MKTKLLAAVGLAMMSAPAVAATVGHVHDVLCNHQWFEDQGAWSGGFNAPVTSSMSSGGLTFILNDLGGVGIGSQARAGFEAAVALWSAVLTDAITIRLDVRFATLGTGILGSTGSTTNTIGFGALKTALTGDITSATDTAAVGSLQTGPLTFVSNEPPISGPIDSRTRFLDNNNTFDNNNIQSNTAQLKALGLTPTYASNNPDGRDGSISFSDAFQWDFDRSDGIDAGAFDFVYVAAHEIGHALGFRSGVDLADINALPGVALPGVRGLNNIGWGTIYDLFRYGSFENQQRLDWSIGGMPCFSIDAGASCEGLLSTGRLNGDGRQASHWKDDSLIGPGLPLGIMDPTVGRGVTPARPITALDLRAFDAMGYNLARIAAVPEPETWAMMLVGFGMIGSAMRRRRSSIAKFA